MRALARAVAVMATLGGGAAFAQSPGGGDSDAIAVPPAPPVVAAPPTAIQPIPVPAAPPPGLVTATPPADIDTGATQAQTPPADNSGGQGQAQDQNTAPDIAPVPPNTWLPGKTARIGVLDKIDGSVSQLSIPVGGQSVVGDLQVSVQACMTRPPDQVPDAAVFLALQSTQNASAPPDYRGWLVRSAPGAAVAGDASETFRIIGCS
jgi:hypothetical protein